MYKDSMDRCAIFVDAGYLLAGGGLICCGTKKRAEIDCDYEGVTRALSSHALSNCGLSVLRIYWYDGAPNAIPMPDHLEVANLTNVKLRLGRLTGGEQKGVDSLIVRDLMTLARERAIATAYLVSGDEDLREGVVAAQDMGVRVVLLGLPSDKRQNQAATLIREADEHLVLEKEFWIDHFRLRESSTPTSADGESAAAQPARLSPTEAGRRFAEQWLVGATDEEADELIAQHPSIPRPLDAQLLRAAEQSLGSLRESQERKKELRAGFWEPVVEKKKKKKGPGQGPHQNR